MKAEKDTRKTALARKDHLVVQELQEETLVYDLKRHTAHCLNQTAAFVWDHCDGQTEVATIAKLLAKELQKPMGEDVIWLALKQLQNANLLQENVIAGGVSRRDVIRRMGVGSAAVLAVPLVTTILAPTASAAATPPAECLVCVNVSDGPAACNQLCSDVIGGCIGNISTECVALGNGKGYRSCAGCATCIGNNKWSAAAVVPPGGDGAGCGA